MKWTLSFAFAAALIAAPTLVRTEQAQQAPRPQQDPPKPAPGGTTLDEAVPPGANYDKAEFRLWFPDNAGPFRAVVVIVPGSNGDWRNQTDTPAWREFATKNNVAIVGCRFTDKPHDQSFIEEYINVSKGSGQALETALGAFATKSKHAEVATAPLLLWGMSAGGQFNYEFVAWKPERVAAFVVNKGGIYYSALLSKAAREVPGILYIGGKDLEFRVNTIVGLFAVNRRGGALWALANEPASGHAVGRSQDLTMAFFEDVMELRAKGAPINEKSGFIGDLKAKTYQAAAGLAAPTGPTAWLPTERVAKMWKAMETETPFEK